MDAWQKFLKEMVGKSNVKKLQEFFGYHLSQKTKRDPNFSSTLKNQTQAKP